MNITNRIPSRRRHLTVLIPAVLIAGIAAWIPQYYGPVVTYQVGQFLIIAIAVFGVNLVTGYTGQISIGHSAFFGVGAYGTAILAADAQWPQFVALVAAVVVAFVIGALCGFPALRIKGLYLAIVTLALAAVFPAILNRFSDVTGGVSGKQDVPSMHAPLWTGLADDQWICYVLICCTAAVFLLAKVALQGRVGRALGAIRENDVSASVYGVNQAKYKVLVFGVSAAITAFAGGLFTLQGNLLASGSEYFTIIGSIEFLAAVVIGGAGTVLGPLFGAAVIFYLPDILAEYNAAFAPLFYGALLIAIILLMPAGIMGILRRSATWGKGLRSRRRHANPKGEGDTAKSRL